MKKTMRISLTDEKGGLLDLVSVDALTREEAHEVMDQVREIVRKRR